MEKYKLNSIEKKIAKLFATRIKYCIEDGESLDVFGTDEDFLIGSEDFSARDLNTKININELLKVIYDNSRATYLKSIDGTLKTLQREIKSFLEDLQVSLEKKRKNLLKSKGKKK